MSRSYRHDNEEHGYDYNSSTKFRKVKQSKIYEKELRVDASKHKEVDLVGSDPREKDWK